MLETLDCVSKVEEHRNSYYKTSRAFDLSTHLRTHTHTPPRYTAPLPHKQPQPHNPNDRRHKSTNPTTVATAQFDNRVRLSGTPVAVVNASIRTTVAAVNISITCVYLKRPSLLSMRLSETTVTAVNISITCVYLKRLSLLSTLVSETTVAAVNPSIVRLSETTVAALNTSI